MKSIWKVIAFIVLGLVALGGILIGTAILLNADLFRIQELFNSTYGVSSLYEYFFNAIHNLLGIQPL